MPALKPYPHYEINVKDNSIYRFSIDEILPVHRPMWIMSTQEGPVGEPVWCPTASYLKKKFGEQTINMANAKFASPQSFFLTNTMSYDGAFIVRALPADAKYATAILEAVVESTDVPQYLIDNDSTSSTYGERIVDINPDSETYGKYILKTDNSGEVVTEPGIKITYRVREARYSTPNDPASMEDLSDIKATPSGSATVYPILAFRALYPGEYGKDLAFRFFYKKGENDSASAALYKSIFNSLTVLRRDYNSSTTNIIYDIYGRTYNTFTADPDAADPESGIKLDMENVITSAFDVDSADGSDFPFTVYTYEENIRTIGNAIINIEKATSDGGAHSLAFAEFGYDSADEMNGYQIDILSGLNIKGIPYDHVAISGRNEIDSSVSYIYKTSYDDTYLDQKEYWIANVDNNLGYTTYRKLKCGTESQVASGDADYYVGMPLPNCIIYVGAYIKTTDTIYNSNDTYYKVEAGRFVKLVPGQDYTVGANIALDTTIYVGAYVRADDATYAANTKYFRIINGVFTELVEGTDYNVGDELNYSVYVGAYKASNDETYQDDVIYYTTTTNDFRPLVAGTQEQVTAGEADYVVGAPIVGTLYVRNETPQLTQDTFYGEGNRHYFKAIKDTNGNITAFKALIPGTHSQVIAGEADYVVGTAIEGSTSVYEINGSAYPTDSIQYQSGVTYYKKNSDGSFIQLTPDVDYRVGSLIALDTTIYEINDGAYRTSQSNFGNSTYYKKNSDGSFTQLSPGVDYNIGDEIPYNNLVFERETIDNPVNYNDPTERVVLDSNIDIFLLGGSDGELSTATVEERDNFIDKYVYNFLKLRINPKIVDKFRYPITHLYDPGFSMTTKKAMLDFLDIRDDVAVELSTQVLFPSEWVTGISRKIKLNDQAADIELGMTLREHALMMRESVLKGTGCMRASIYPQAGIPISATYTKPVPFTLWSAVQHAQYGNTDQMSVQEPRGLPYSYNEMFKSWNWTNYSELLKEKTWNAGLNYCQYADMKRIFYPALRTVYREETSVLVDQWVVDALVYTKHECRKAWARFSGRNDKQAVLEQAIKVYLEGILSYLYNGKYDFTVEVYKTEEEKKLGYIEHVKLSLVFPATMRVINFDIEVNREGYTPESEVNRG